MAPEGLQVCLGVPSEREPITTAEPEPSEEQSFQLQAWQRKINKMGTEEIGRKMPSKTTILATQTEATSYGCLDMFNESA